MISFWNIKLSFTNSILIQGVQKLWGRPDRFLLFGLEKLKSPHKIYKAEKCTTRPMIPKWEILGAAKRF